MLVAVEDAEEEALHTEKIVQEKKRSRERKKLDLKGVKADAMNEIILKRHFALSDQLKLKWAKSFDSCPSHTVENTDVYPKIIEELNELYNNRLEKRIAEIQAEYEEKAQKEKEVRQKRVSDA